MQKVAIADFEVLGDRQPAHALVGEVDLVIVRFDGNVSVLYGRCLHRGALMADGHVDGNNLVCGLHHWDYRLDTGVSAYSHDEVLNKFVSWVDEGKVWVDADEIAEWAKQHPQPFNRTIYLGQYADTGHGTAEEPHNALIQRYAREGLFKTGHHGAVEAMGVPRDRLPSWDDIQILPAQLYRAPLLDEHAVGTEVVIGRRAKKPLTLRIPPLVSDMSFGALSASAKVALARGAATWANACGTTGRALRRPGCRCTLCRAAVPERVHPTGSMSMIDLYFWTTPNGYKPLIFLEESQTPYRLKPVNISAGEQFEPAFLKISPNNRMPAIVDHAPADGGEPMSLFESGAILWYLAEKTGHHFPAELRARKTALEWLMWQMGGLGPMLGQNHHFAHYAPDKLPYAIERYVKETQRLYGVLERRLEGRDFIADDYGVADMAAYPWCLLWHRQGIVIDEFPNLKGWLARIEARPAVQRAYAIGKELNTVPTVTDAAKSVLFGQGRR